MDVLTVCKRKRPAGSGRWQAYALASDAHGAWVFTPAHSTYVSEDGRGGTGRCEVAQDRHGAGRDSLVLLPATGWYVASWVRDADHLVSVDISTPPRCSGSAWTFDDLELDPYLLVDGTFGVEDEDEFAAARAAGLITDQEGAAAEQAVDWLRAQLTLDGSPFVEAGRRRLAEAVRLDLAPLTRAADLRADPAPFPLTEWGDGWPARWSRGRSDVEPE